MTLQEYCTEKNLNYLLKEWSSLNIDLNPASVLAESNAKVWWECECGHRWKASVAQRIQGNNCKCCHPPVEKPLKKKKPRTDLTGKKFGRLSVVEYYGIKKESLWKCKCECGNELIVTQNKLTSGKTTSCGCRQNEMRKKNFKNHIHFVEGTCIEEIAAKTTPSNNTSGFRGVYVRKNGYFRVSITFKGKRYDLGTYQTLEEAIKARLAGEYMMDEFVDNYRKNKIQ